MNVMRYVQGDWFAVIVDQLIVMLSPETSPALIDQVWDAAHAGASLEEHLSLVIAGGLAPTFALVHVQDGRLRGYLRGGVTLEVVDGIVEPPAGGAASTEGIDERDASQVGTGERTQFTASSDVPWLGVAIRDMTEVWLAVPATVTQTAVLPVSAGVVRASQVGFLIEGAEHTFDDTLFGPTILGVPSHVRTELDAHSADHAGIDELFGETILEVSARVRTAPRDQAHEAVNDEAANDDVAIHVGAIQEATPVEDATADVTATAATGARTTTATTAATSPLGEHEAEDDELFGETILEVSARVRTAQEPQSSAPVGDHAHAAPAINPAINPATIPVEDADDDEAFGETVLDVPAFAHAQSGAHPGDDELFGHTIIDPNAIARLRESRPAAPAPAPPTAPSPRAPARVHPRPVQASAVMVSDADHDGDTVMSSDLVEIRAQLPTWSKDAVPGPFRVPDKVAPPKLMLSTGVVVTLDRTVLIGRSPAASRVSNRNLPRLVTVESPNHDISRTHVQVQAEGHRVFVTDLNSTNGVTLSPRGRAPESLRPSVPTDLPPDATVDIGDGVTFRVVRH